VAIVQSLVRSLSPSLNFRSSRVTLSSTGIENEATFGSKSWFITA